MDQATIRFTERMGQLMELDGLPRTAGRIFALLLLSGEPRSLDELRTELSVSKASASTNARLLAHLGVLERTNHPADRRDYYAVVPDLFPRVMEQRMARWQRFTEALGEARRTLPIRDAAVQDRLAEYEEAYSRMRQAIGESVARWKGDPSTEQVR